MEEEQIILRRELLGEDDLITCALCQRVVSRSGARQVPGAEVGSPDAEYLWICSACYRQLRAEEPVEPELTE